MFNWKPDWFVKELADRICSSTDESEGRHTTTSLVKMTSMYSKADYNYVIKKLSSCDNPSSPPWKLDATRGALRIIREYYESKSK